MEIIDRKFVFKAINPCNGHEYSNKDALVLCARDAAVPEALKAYRLKCIELGAGVLHILSIEKLIDRVEEYQEEIESRVPDTIGECEIGRCLRGEGVE